MLLPVLISKEILSLHKTGEEAVFNYVNTGENSPTQIGVN